MSAVLQAAPLARRLLLHTYTDHTQPKDPSFGRERRREKKKERKKKQRRKKDSPAFDLLCRSVRVVDDAPEAVLAVVAVLAVAIVRAPVLKAY